MFCGFYQIASQVRLQLCSQMYFPIAGLYGAHQLMTISSCILIEKSMYGRKSLSCAGNSRICIPLCHTEDGNQNSQRGEWNNKISKVKLHNSFSVAYVMLQISFIMATRSKHSALILVEPWTTFLPYRGGDVLRSYWISMKESTLFHCSWSFPFYLYLGWLLLWEPLDQGKQPF